MGTSSQPHHDEAVLNMRLVHGGEFEDYYLLRIWDGRYAAFWKQGLGGDHSIAVAEHMTNEEHGSTWPFAFISESREKVERYINDPINGNRYNSGGWRK